MPTHDTAPQPGPRASGAGLRVLVTGATGYVGSRLVPKLLEDGHHVLAATRDVTSVEEYPWAAEVESCAFDVEDEELIAAAVSSVDAVVYLVHSMEADDFVEKDRAAAERVAAACQRAGVERVVYLSGLVPEGDLSDHLSSRLEVEQVFLDAEVPAVVLRAAMVIGAGSTSYELLRRLSQRVPLLTPVPRWMRSRLQPVAIDDMVHVISCALLGPPRNRHYDVGGDEVLTYPELLAAFAGAARLRRRRFLVPGLPVWFVGRVCALISAMPMSTVGALVESLKHDMICDEYDVRHDLLDSEHRFTSVADAFSRALRPAEDQGTSRSGDVVSAAATDPA